MTVGRPGAYKSMHQGKMPTKKVAPAAVAKGPRMRYKNAGVQAKVKRGGGPRGR